MDTSSRIRYQDTHLGSRLPLRLGDAPPPDIQQELEKIRAAARAAIWCRYSSQTRGVPLSTFDDGISLEQAGSVLGWASEMLGEFEESLAAYRLAIARLERRRGGVTNRADAVGLQKDLTPLHITRGVCTCDAGR